MRPQEPFEVRLRFHGDLHYFLKGDQHAPGELTRHLNEPTSVKDVVESCGVPHTEVDRLLVENTAVDFSYVIRNNTEIAVYPVGISGSSSSGGEPLQRIAITQFVADGHLGKLTRNLRLLGCDVSYDSSWDDHQLLEIMQSEQRALLTRDRRLLMHGVVRDGYCPRSSDPMEQTIEVVRRFHLHTAFRPFTRCLHCNSMLRPVEKREIIDQLEPLTRVYYNEFRSCTGCGKVFWRGSHFSKLETFLERIQGSVSGSGG